MWIDGHIKFLGKIDIISFKKSVSAISYKIYDLDHRNKSNFNFRNSETIWLIESPTWAIENEFHCYYNLNICNDETFLKNILQVHTDIESLYNGVIVRSCLIRLRPFKFIHTHIDPPSFYFFRYSSRLIIPIITNPQASIQYDNDIYFLEEGYVYDTNPYIPHSTKNSGSEDRIHLVIDIVPYRYKEHISKIKKYTPNDILDYRKISKINSVNYKTQLMENYHMHNWQALTEYERKEKLLFEEMLIKKGS